MVSPLHFNKDIIRTPSHRRLAYQKLEEILEQEGSVNPYQVMLLGPDPEETTPDHLFNIDMYEANQNNPGRVNTQNMEDWSVLSTEMCYADPPQGHPNLMVMDCKTTLLNEWEKSGKAPTVIGCEVPESPVMDMFLDQFDTITTRLNTTGQFQDNRDVSTTYLGNEVITKKDHFLLEEHFPITSTSHTWGQLVGGGTMNILLDTGASKCYMSRAYFERNKILHGLPRLKSTIKSLRVGNGNEVNAHFVIPVLLKIAGHKFEIYALVSEIQPTIDLVLGMKNMHELEGELSPRNSEFRFLNRAIPLFTLQRLVSLKILSKNTTSHTSPVMLITRKVTKDKRPVVDFRLLNTRIKRHNTATPLLRDIYQMLGKAQSTVLSCVDLKDAFHSLKLTDRAKDFCGILPYFGSPHYRYEVMPMGLSISPCKWIQYIGYVMEKMPHPENYIAIMDDLLVHSRESEHMDRILDMLKALVEHGLKLSPKKCQFFRNELVYMGNTFKTGQKGITITPIKTRQEAILNTPTPRTPKDCKSFCGVVNYVSLFCPNLQKLLAPIYDLTRKGRPFVWTKLHQDNFDKIKKQMASPPVLTLPTSTGRYILYSDTSKLHAGSALWQIQHGQPRLVGYASKSLPKACANYGITELEMTGLLYNMVQWKYWLGKKDFDAAVDHRAIPYIMKAKHLPTTDRITRLLEGLNQFTFHLYYVKGKDMILCDFLSRVAVDDSDPMDLIPIAFNVYDLLQDHYARIEAYNVMTRAARAAA